MLDWRPPLEARGRSPWRNAADLRIRRPWPARHAKCCAAPVSRWRVSTTIGGSRENFKFIIIQPLDLFVSDTAKKDVRP